LGVKTIGELDAAVKKALNELKILDSSIVGNKPAKIAGLKITAPYVTAKDSAYTVNSRPKDSSGKVDDKNLDLQHYHFVL